MAIDQDLLDKLRSALESAELPEDYDIDVLLSEQVIKNVIPVLAPYIQTYLEQKSEKDAENISKIQEIFVDGVPVNLSGVDVDSVIDQIVSGYASADYVKSIINFDDKNWLEKILISGGIVLLQIFAIINAAYSAEQEKIRQTVNEAVRPFLLDLQTLTRLYYREPEKESDVKAEMRKMGISDDKIELYLRMQEQLIPLDIIRFLANREIITDDQADEYLRKLQFSNDDISLIKQAFKTYPGVTDLVRFAVREVFSPDLAQSLGLYQDMPDEFLSEAEKQGLPPEYAKMYWGAHWVPPAITHAFEMFHRGVIDYDELQDLLRVNDYMPNYRDKLTEIAYNPVTRVDLRRIYQDGYLSFEELVNGYLDLGYSPENAELISKWVDSRYGEERKNLTKSSILKLYRYEVLTREEAVQYLQDLGYSADNAEDLVTAEELQQAERVKKRKIRLYRKIYLKGESEPGTVKALLSQAGVSDAEISELIEEWELEKAEQIRYLSKDDITDFYKSGMITREYAEEKLSEIGYRDEDVELILALADRQKG